jgi:hypothetical protein
MRHTLSEIHLIFGTGDAVIIVTAGFACGALTIDRSKASEATSTLAVA